MGSRTGAACCKVRREREASSGSIKMKESHVVHTDTQMERSAALGSDRVDVDVDDRCVIEGKDTRTHEREDLARHYSNAGWI